MSSARVLLAAALLLGLAGCSAAVAEPAGLTVDATSCSLGTSSAPAGTLTFTVTNPGSEVAGFALLDDGTVVGELTGLAPGASRALVVAVDKGSYLAQCIPATGGTPITAAFTVGAGVTPHLVSTEQRDAATASYAQYVTEQSAALDRAVTALAADYTAGTATLEQYREARAHWIALRPLSASFSDLVPRLDASENDLVAGEQWTGLQRIAADLAQPTLAQNERSTLATTLQTDIAQVLARISAAPPLSAESIAAGAVNLVDHASVSLDDRADPAEVLASLSAARAAYGTLEPITDPTLAALIATRFEATATPGPAALDALAEALAELEGRLA